MKLRAVFLGVVLIAMFLSGGVDAETCIRFKQPAGAVPPGLREPPVSEPAGARPTRPARRELDFTTWETWWETNRVGFFPRRTAAVEAARRDDGPVEADSIEARVWDCLLEAAEYKQVFVAESALFALGRAAASEAQRAAARKLLLKKMTHRNRLIARHAVFGLAHVADDASIRLMAEQAMNDKAPEDVRAFLALTIASLGHPTANQLLKDLVRTSGDAELVGAALVGLGLLRGGDLSGTATYLTDVAFEQQDVLDRHRAVAVESLGRLGSVALVKAPLLRALADDCALVRGAAAAAFGGLDYRSESEPAGVQQIETRLVRTMNTDADAFVRRMAAISLGRIAARNPRCKDAARHLQLQVEADRVGMREFALLALAIAGDPSLIEHALASLQSEDPSSRGAACIALGLAASKDRETQDIGDALRGRAYQRLCEVLTKDPHPFVCGYASLALGLVGLSDAAPLIKHSVDTTRTVETRAYGLLALALLGSPDASAGMLAFDPTVEMGNAVAMIHAVYALGLTKERTETTYTKLIEMAKDPSNMYVQAASIMALGCLSSDELYPRRHLQAVGYSYRAGFDHIDTYFLRL